MRVHTYVITTERQVRAHRPRSLHCHRSLQAAHSKEWGRLLAGLTRHLFRAKRTLGLSLSIFTKKDASIS